MPGLLLHSPAEVIAQLLVDLGLGVAVDNTTTTQWQVFSLHEPDRPDYSITVYEVTGIVDVRTMPDRERAEWDGIQIKLRCPSEAVGSVKARAIAVALDSVAQQVVVVGGGTSYNIWCFNRSSGPIPLGKEPNSDRRSITINGTVSLRKI